MHATMVNRRRAGLNRGMSDEALYYMRSVYMAKNDTWARVHYEDSQYAYRVLGRQS